MILECSERLTRFLFPHHWLAAVGVMVLPASALDPSLEILASGLELNGTGGQSSGTVETYTIPYEDFPDSITIDMYGGDGGRAKANTDVGADQQADGGGGLRTNANFKVHPSNENSLRPGGELLFVIGNRGDYETSNQASASGGGGGTGLLYRGPEPGSGWELLAVSGGGGGGVASTQIVNTYEREGGNASATTRGEDGEGSISGSGGSNGGEGEWYSYNGVTSGGGGGGFNSAGSTNMDGAQASITGSAGGDAKSLGGYGGFGYGGGGGGGTYDFDSIGGVGTSGGGGGGYSGGGSGGHRKPGGGGGSYLNSDFTNFFTQTERESSNDSGKATVTYTVNASNSLVGPTVTPIGDDPYILYDYEDLFFDPGVTPTDLYGNPATLTGGFDTVVPGRVGIYSVTYQAIDDYGNTGSGTRAVWVISAFRPTFDISGDVTRDEDSGSYGQNNFVSNFNANDSGQSLEYYEVTNNNADLFATQPAISNGGKLTFTPADDANGSATVTVVAFDNLLDDNNGFSDPVTFTITVTPVDDPPTLVGLSNATVAENETVIGVVSGTEPFGGELSYAIGSGEEYFSIDADSGELLFLTGQDFENPTDMDGDNSYEVTVTTTGTDGERDTDFTITVSNVDEAPSLPTIDNMVVLEGTISVGTVLSTDPEGDVVSYSITVGPDKDLFTIDSSSGELSFLTAPDYDNPSDRDGMGDYLVRVKASANGLDSDSLLVTVTVSDENEQPTAILLDGADVTTDSVSEGAPNDEVIAVLTGVDPDENETFTFTLTNDAGGRFHIINDDELAVADSSLIDYESSTSHSVTIELADSGGLTLSKTVDVSVTDVEESALDEFRAQYGLSENGSDDELDWSENGVANILYLAFGLGDPSDFDVDRTRFPVLSNTDGVLSYSFLIPAEAGDLRIAPQASSALAEWVLLGDLDQVDRPGPPTEEIVDTDFIRRTYLFPAGSTMSYFRLEVGVNEGPPTGSGPR